MEEKKKAGPRFNLLDVVLILLALLCVVGVWQRKNIQNLFSSEKELADFTVSFEVRKMRGSVAEFLAKDAVLYLVDGDDRIELGRLTEQPSKVAAVEYLPNSDGELVEAVYPDDANENLLDVKGTLLCRGVEYDGSFLLGGEVFLSVNQTVLVQTELADFEIRITAIKSVTAN